MTGAYDSPALDPRLLAVLVCPLTRTALRYDEKMIDARRDLGIAQATMGKTEKATEQLAALKALQEACGGICANSAKIADGIARIEAAIAAGPQAQGWVEPEIRLA